MNAGVGDGPLRWAPRDSYIRSSWDDCDKAFRSNAVAERIETVGFKASGRILLLAAILGGVQWELLQAVAAIGSSKHKS